MNKQKEMWKALMLSSLIFAPLSGHAQDIEATLLLKQPGNLAVAHQLHLNINQSYVEFAIRDNDKPMGVATLFVPL